MTARFLPIDHLDVLIATLAEQGFRVVGPRVRDGAIVYDDVARADDLPRGIRVRQTPGMYRVEQTDDQRYFAWANGPQSLKPLFFPAREDLWSVVSSADGLSFASAVPDTPPLAVIGARACDLAALSIHDRHFSNDPQFRRRRNGAFIVAVDCGHPAETCFCASTGDGPRASADYDVALTEVEGGFVARSHTVAGCDVLDELGLAAASPITVAAAEKSLADAAARQTRKLPPAARLRALMGRLDHPRWLEVAERCLSCGNCATVCPTCFCHSQRDDPDLTGLRTTHFREWDTCFSESHGYIHGVQVRPDIRTRYRQWLTHKLATWQDQFGRSGCVGCGRCIAWCPVGIDLTEEIDHLLGP